MATAGIMAGGMAGPALASTQSHERYASAAVTADWRSRVRLPSGFELTTWFVGVFPSSGRTYSQLYKQVIKCQKVNGRERCRLVSFSFGFTRSLSATQFTWDRKHLQSAHLAATYKVRTFRPKKPAQTSKVTIVAAWTGTGKITHSGGVSTFHSKCIHYHNTFRGRNRKATATGSANGTSLGTARGAALSTQVNVILDHTC